MFIKKALILILIMVLTACATRGPSDKERAVLHLRLGTGHLTKGNYPQALAELLKAEQLDPDNKEIQNNLGLAYFVRDRYEQANHHLKTALRIDNKFTEARNNLGMVYIQMGNYKDAVKELRIAADDLTYPTPHKSFSNLGLAYFKMRKFDLAKQAYRNSLKTFRKNCQTYSMYGRTYFELKNYKLAAQTLDQAVRICKKINYDEPHYYSALSYLNIGQKEKAVARLEEVIKEYKKGRYKKEAKRMISLIK